MRAGCGPGGMDQVSNALTHLGVFCCFHKNAFIASQTFILQCDCVSTHQFVFLCHRGPRAAPTQASTPTALGNKPHQFSLRIKLRHKQKFTATQQVTTFAAAAAAAGGSNIRQRKQSHTKNPKVMKRKSSFSASLKLDLCC